MGLIKSIGGCGCHSIRRKTGIGWILSLTCPPWCQTGSILTIAIIIKPNKSRCWGILLENERRGVANVQLVPLAMSEPPAELKRTSFLLNRIRYFISFAMIILYIQFGVLQVTGGRVRTWTQRPKGGNSNGNVWIENNCPVIFIYYLAPVVWKRAI